MGKAHVATALVLAALGVMAAVAVGSRLVPPTPDPVFPAADGFEAVTTDDSGTTTEDATTSGDDDGTLDQGPGDAPRTPISDALGDDGRHGHGRGRGRGRGGGDGGHGRGRGRGGDDD